MRQEKVYYLLAEFKTGVFLKSLLFTRTARHVGCQHIQKVDIVRLQQQCIAVEESVGEMTVWAERPLIGELRFLKIQRILYEGSDKKIGRRVVALRKRVAIADGPVGASVVEPVHIVLNHVAGVGILLRDIVDAQFCARSVILAVADVVNLVIVGQQVAVRVNVVDFFAILVFFQMPGQVGF